MNKNAVCNEGIKSVIEIKPRKLVQGIGGFQTHVVSFTYDESFAKGYAMDILLLSRIAHGIVTPRNIEAYLDRNDSMPGMEMKPSEIFRRIINAKMMGDVSIAVYSESIPRKLSVYAKQLRSGRRRVSKRETEEEELAARSIDVYDGLLDDLKKGIIYDRKTVWHYMQKQPSDECARFLKKQAGHVMFGDVRDDEVGIGPVGGDRRILKIGIDDDEICKEATEDDFAGMFLDEIHPDDHRKITVAERQSIIFDIVMNFYFRMRQEKRGRQDPYFFSIRYIDYLRIHPSDVGLFKVLAYIPEPIESYLEDRIFKMSGSINGKYPRGSESTDEIVVVEYEREVRIPPKYTTMLEEIPI